MEDDGQSYTVQLSALKKADYVVLNGHPCKVTETGHRGHKIRVVGLDIFTKKRYEEEHNSAQNMQAFHVTRQEYAILSITEDGCVNVLAENFEKPGNLENIKLPEGTLGDEIREWFEKEGRRVRVTLVTALGQTGVVAAKTEGRVFL
ncbi:Eukaryotic translation initiation factor 5A [Orbilia ellipsospora]|uniref:Eukaryotic translation initiation factor 5A n=1 Tax=Orbilia ellipsospora TaxID=2528407 RepID=A0AAV9WVD9_9PEZI